MSKKIEVSGPVKVRVELFGVARLISGVKELELRLPEALSERELAAALAEASPALLGRVIHTDLSGLMEGYLFNLNGVAFLGREAAGSQSYLRLKSGDSLLLVSSQAGG